MTIITVSEHSLTITFETYLMLWIWWAAIRSSVGLPDHYITEQKEARWWMQPNGGGTLMRSNAEQFPCEYSATIGEVVPYTLKLAPRRLSAYLYRWFHTGRQTETSTVQWHTLATSYRHDDNVTLLYQHFPFPKEQNFAIKLLCKTRYPAPKLAHQQQPEHVLNWVITVQSQQHIQSRDYLGRGKQLKLANGQPRTRAFPEELRNIWRQRPLM